MLLAAATSSQLLNLPVLQLPCPVSCTCCEGPTGPTSGIRRYSFVATSKIISIAFSSACYSCNIATARSVRHDGSTAAARSLPGWRSKVVDGLWGGGENSCREPFSQLRRVNGARPLPSAVRRLRLRCRLNEGRVHVRDLTSVATDKPLASTSDTEQIPGGGSLPRDLVSTPQSPIGVHMLRANCFGELRIRVVSDPGPRTPEGTGGGGVAWRGVAPRGF